MFGQMMIETMEKYGRGKKAKERREKKKFQNQNQNGKSDKKAKRFSCCCHNTVFMMRFHLNIMRIQFSIKIEQLSTRNHEQIIIFQLHFHFRNNYLCGIFNNCFFFFFLILENHSSDRST